MNDGDAGTENQGLQSKPSASLDNTLTSTQTLNQKSMPMLSSEKSVLPISEKSYQHAVLAKVLLSKLEKAGLIRRFKVLSEKGVWMETQLVFDNSFWDESLELKVFSDLTTVNETVVEPMTTVVE